MDWLSIIVAALIIGTGLMESRKKKQKKEAKQARKAREARAKWPMGAETLPSNRRGVPLPGILTRNPPKNRG